MESLLKPAELLDRLIPLSPAAQAIVEAYGYPLGGTDTLLHLPHHLKALAAALRAAAFQLSFGHATGSGVLCEDDLFAIAAELEGAGG